MRDATARRLSSLHTFLFRASGGRIGHRLIDNDMLLLTTTGHRSGSRHTVPLLYLSSGAMLVVIASWGGRPDHPHWYQNLLHDPRATVELRGEAYDVVARTATREEKEKWWPRITEAYAGYSTYQARTERDIPVVFLDPQ